MSLWSISLDNIHKTLLVFYYDEHKLIYITNQNILRTQIELFRKKMDLAMLLLCSQSISKNRKIDSKKKIRVFI